MSKSFLSSAASAWSRVSPRAEMRRNLGPKHVDQMPADQPDLMSPCWPVAKFSRTRISPPRLRVTISEGAILCRILLRLGKLLQPAHEAGHLLERFLLAGEEAEDGSGIGAQAFDPGLVGNELLDDAFVETGSGLLTVGGSDLAADLVSTGLASPLGEKLGELYG